ncbi:MAG: NUDIX domain-containing protein [Clostridia bacterium]
MEKGIKISAGLVIIENNKILLEHPTGSKWFGTYSIPKGEIKNGEEPLDAALRETEEELGITLDPDEISKAIGPEIIMYFHPTTRIVYKHVYYYVIYLKNPIIIDINKLQKEETDWAGFLTKEEAEKRIFGKQTEVLKYLK